MIAAKLKRRCFSGFLLKPTVPGRFTTEGHRIFIVFPYAILVENQLYYNYRSKSVYFAAASFAPKTEDPVTRKMTMGPAADDVVCTTGRVAQLARLGQWILTSRSPKTSQLASRFKIKFLAREPRQEAAR